MSNNREIEAILSRALSDGFNRSINALEECGAIDTAKLTEKYSGVGSEYYDIVTQALEHTARQFSDAIAEVAGKRS
ncbi:hypothetical protein MIB92_06390 [Aestuariirhabdus sp. Z084]|uniref:hypothetical protein n=1 Tax=Aestuariirhabdus haliotis TaxID=2918751 RepID=UPI00201B42D6|nr:hypothetical protein [Aestuariirhabdus haliotis]MCL6415271.1 hypothetical protein [Aestuariirhabdus haliotis]MCL6419531.1 hypothetical protein [Aestuariirhabdus haliotis]